MNNVTLSNSVYDKLKRLTQVGLPALGTLYFTLSVIWGLPASEQVVGSIAALTTFCGVILGVSAKNYDFGEDGQIHITHPEPGKKLFSLDLEGDPQDMEHGDVIQFKVVDEDDKFWERPFNLDNPNAE